ncbi:MAG: hypothetical protein NTV03_01305 [Candidatus Nomurabacteria bacterium]|nr:hypothetical protein [Candidatus Nomurabacteria bacterium]
MKNKIWFRRKLYGWGWYPSTLEGWLVILVWALLFASLMSRIDHEGLKNIFFVFIITGLLIYVCYKKGEKPRWQWGKRKEDIK